MKALSIFFILTLLISCSSKKEKDSKNKLTSETVYVLHDGTYTLEMIDVEIPPENREKGPLVTATVKGNRILIIYEGEDLPYMKKGTIIEDGVLLKHIETGKWIIGRKEEDIYAKLIGGCVDGPRIIDMINGLYYFC